MSNTQRVSVELKNGKFRLTGGQKTDDLNPKSLILYAAAECAGLTIMGILRKDEITPKRFEITVEGTLDTPTLAAESRYRSFAVHYNVECKSLSNQNGVSCAIHEAQEGRCGVVAMLKMIAPVSHEIAIVSSETVNV